VRSKDSLGSSRKVAQGCGVSFVNCIYLVTLIISQNFCALVLQTTKQGLDRAAGDRRAAAPPTPRRWPRSASSLPPLRPARPPRLRPTSSHTAPAPAPALVAARPCWPRRHRHPVPGSAPACPTSCAPALAGRGATATQAVRSLPWQEAVRQWRRTTENLGVVMYL
jgi:hypothetical protein